MVISLMQIWQMLMGWLAPLRHNPNAYPLGYSPGLDGLRGLMTIGVMAAHLRETWVTGAFVYMDSFFLMSAYLITALLVRGWQREGRIRYGRFYYRRVLRLFPANYAMLLVFVLAAWLWLDDFAGHLQSALAAGLYVSNWTRAFEIQMPGFLGHTWSLSIEEQYYLLWPLLLGWLLRVSGLRLRTVGLVVLAAIIASVWRAYLVYDGASIARLYNGTDTRADALLLGCALGLALALPAVRTHPGLNHWAARLAVPAAIVLVVAGFTLHWQMRVMYAGGSLLLMLVSMVLVTALVLPARTWAHRVFEAAPLVFLGRICYGLYLWHWPVYSVMREGFGLGLVWLLTLGVPLTFLLAIASYLWVERPFLAIKDRMQESKS